MTFKALTDFWHDKLLVPAGTLIDLTEAEVKYLKHAVVEVKDEVKAVVAKVEKIVEDVKTDAKA